MADLDPQKVQAVLQDYAETLEVLTINSKPLINDLTMAAERYKPLAARIVGVIEARLFEVPVNQKLPLLYLLDSIMKNLRGPYLEVINAKVVAIFCHCFEKLTEPKIRISLYKLRQTWNPFVVKKKLAAIDKHVHALDPNWPVTATVTAPTSPTIHVNPDFLPAGEKAGKKVFASTASTPQTATGSSVQQGHTKPAPAPSAKKEQQLAPATTTPAPTLEQKRKSVLAALKRKKEELKAQGATELTVSTPAVKTPSLTDPRKASVGTVPSSSGPKTTQVKRGKKRSSLALRRPLSSRSSLSPDYDSKSDNDKRKKVSSRPRSASPTTPPSSRPRPHLRPDATHPGSQGEGGRKEGGGIGEFLRGLDIPSLMGSIQRVKERAPPAAPETKKEEPKVDQPPPEKKPKLYNDVATATPTLSAREEVGGVKGAEDEDALPAIKSSHLDLDDIPMELLPTHQGKIMKQVERQLKSGRLSEEQHSILVKQLDQLYTLQRKKENGREGRGREDDSPEPQTDPHKSPSPPPAVQTDHPLPSDSLRSQHTNHLPPSPSPPPPSAPVPPPTLSDSDFRPTLSPPPPHRPAGPHLDRHPHTHSHQQQPPRDRYPPPPRPFPHDGPPRGSRGARPYRGGSRGPPRGRRPFNRPPPPSRGPAIDWYGQGAPPDRSRGQGPSENPPLPQNTNYPPNQGNAGGSDPGELFSKLVQMGIIKEGEGSREVGVVPPQPARPMPPEHGGPPVPFAIPKLSFTVATLKKPYSSLVHLMYVGDPCATCGLRFRDRSTAHYSSHLDWHYKVNSRDKSLPRPRNWFLHPEDWIKFEESTTAEEDREPLVLEREVEGREEGGEGEGGPQEEGQETSCEVLPGEEAEVCTICAEQFEQFWEEELEEWHFREAVREEGKLYHTYCYQDAKESGALDRSLQQPSPSAAEHKPLAVA